MDENMIVNTPCTLFPFFLVMQGHEAQNGISSKIEYCIFATLTFH